MQHMPPPYYWPFSGELGQLVLCPLNFLPVLVLEETFGEVTVTVETPQDTQALTLDQLPALFVIHGPLDS